MKTYPSIGKTVKGGGAQFFIFDKLDGSNLRFEWSTGQGWYKFGSRTRLFDETDPILGPAKPLFMNTLAEPLAKIATDNRWPSVVVFAEFHGPGSFAGQHVAGEAYTLSLFDAAPYKKGILGPEEFLKLFGHLQIAKYLGRHVVDAAFIERVRAGEFEGMSFEGVIGKRGEGHKLEMVKAKTQAWIDKVRSLYTAEEADKLIDS
jgi:hypothetical protein